MGHGHGSHGTFKAGHSCDESKPHDEIPIPYFKDSDLLVYKNQLICLKRFNETFYLKNFFRAAKGTNCKEGTRACGMLNHFGDLVCVNKTVNCPVTQISIQKEQLEGFTNILFNDGSYFSYSNKEHLDSHVPIDFFLSEGKPCIDHNRIANRSEVYPLSNKINQFGCNPIRGQDQAADRKYIDDRYTYLDNITKREFLKNNDLYYSVKKLPLLDHFHINEHYFDTNFTLYYKYRITSNESCYSSSQLVQNAKDTDSIKMYAYTLLIWEIINVVAIVTFVSLKSIFKVSNQKWKWAIVFFRAFFDLTMIIVNLYELIAVQTVKQDLFIKQQYNLDHCIDEPTQRVKNLLGVESYFLDFESFRVISIVFISLYITVFLIQNSYTVYKIRESFQKHSDVSFVGDINLLDVDDKTIFE